MPDIHSPSDLDRALEALPSVLAVRASRPGAAAAISTARRRRRTTVAGVAAAVVLAVGTAVVPSVGPDRPGPAAAPPDAARLNAAALEAATQEWISGWTADRPSGSFSQPACVGSPASIPPETTRGRSEFAAPTWSGATLSSRGYDRDSQARTAYVAWVDMLGRCDAATGTEVGDYPAGTAVRHYRVEESGDADPGAALTDVWVAASGGRLGVLEVVTDRGPAGAGTVEAVADALVAGIRSGWTQERLPAESPVATRPQLPPYDERGLAAALGGWRPEESMDAFGSPPVPCLDPLRGGTALSEGGDPRRAKVVLTGYPRPGARAAAEAARVVEQMRGCSQVPVTAASLPGGVTLLTFNRGGSTGHGAVWVASNADRAMVVAVAGAATAVPQEAAAAGAAWITEVLGQPWPSAP